MKRSASIPGLITLLLLCACGATPDAKELPEPDQRSTDQLVDELRLASHGFQYEILMEYRWMPGVYVPTEKVAEIVLALSARREIENHLLDTFVVRSKFRRGDLYSSMLFPLLDVLLLAETTCGDSRGEARRLLWDHWLRVYWQHDDLQLDLTEAEAQITEFRNTQPQD